LCHLTSPDHDFEYRNFNEADWDSINACLHQVDWSDLFVNCDTAAECCSEFYTVLNDCICKYVPLHVNNNLRKLRTGIAYPAYVKRLLRKKHAVWKRLKAFRTDSLKAQYRDISSRCRNAIYNSVQRYEESIIDSNNLGRFFRHANSKLVSKTNVGPLQLPDGNITVDPEVKADLLSKHFNTLFNQDNGRSPPLNSTRPVPSRGLSHITFTPELVRRVIVKLKAKSAGGPDGIPPVFLKKCCAALSGPLSYVFQSCFDNSYLPPDWLKAYITPV